MKGRCSLWNIPKHQRTSPNMLTVNNNDDGVVIDGTQYYSQTKVDQLLAEKDSELRTWATNQFQPKA